jgi:signal transduction histidine kinase
MLAQVPDYKHFTRLDGLTAEKVEDVYQTPNGFLYLNTSAGGIVYDGQVFTRLGKSADTSLYPRQQWGQPDLDTIGLGYFQKFEPTCTLVTKTGGIWLGTNRNGLFFVPNTNKTQISDTSAYPNLFIKKIYTQEPYPKTHPTEDTTVYVLTAAQKGIFFELQGVYTDDFLDLEYKFWLEGQDKDWQTTRNNLVRYTNLGAGDYIFWAAVRTEKSGWQPQLVRYRFRIAPPFWWTWWFWSLVGLGLVILLFGYLKRLNNRAQFQKQIWASEQNALRAQMNPHFIFNAMNSILYFVRQNDKRQATAFLASFSTLIRRILDNSKHPLIPLQDEIETLQRYLELERLRLSNPSDNFHIEVDAGLDVQVWKIPPMLVQPLVENAIVHGLLPKTEGERMLIVKFSQKNKQVCISVQDNGIGRRAAAEIQKRRTVTHTSYGSKNIEERLRVLNQLYKRKIRIETKDLYDKNGAAAGTQTLVWLPVLE